MPNALSMACIVSMRGFVVFPLNIWSTVLFGMPDISDISYDISCNVILLFFLIILSCSMFIVFSP